MTFGRDPEKMHRVESGAKSDWENIPHSERNIWQKIAAKTHGIVTPGNVVTVLGGLLVVSGIKDFSEGKKLKGATKISIGRLADVVDGKVADMTGTKSELGASGDATVDMIELGASLVYFTKAGVIPKAASYMTGAPKLVNSASTIMAKARRKSINTEGEGKTGTAAIWLGISSYTLDAALGDRAPVNLSNTLQAIGWVGTVGGTAISLPATKVYGEVGFGSKEQGDITT